MPPAVATATTEKMKIKEEKLDENEVRILMFLSVLYYLSTISILHRRLLHHHLPPTKRSRRQRKQWKKALNRNYYGKCQQALNQHHMKQETCQHMEKLNTKARGSWRRIFCEVRHQNRRLLSEQFCFPGNLGQTNTTGRSQMQSEGNQLGR